MHGGERPTEALEAVLSPTKACVFSRIVTLHFQSERSDVFQRLFFFSLSKHTGLCRAIMLV